MKEENDAVSARDREVRLDRISVSGLLRMLKSVRRPDPSAKALNTEYSRSSSADGHAVSHPRSINSKSHRAEPES